MSQRMVGGRARFELTASSDTWGSDVMAALVVTRISSHPERKALSENLTKRPFLRNCLYPLHRDEPTLVTAIRLAAGSYR